MAYNKIEKQFMFARREQGTIWWQNGTQVLGQREGFGSRRRRGYPSYLKTWLNLPGYEELGPQADGYGYGPWPLRKAFVGTYFIQMEVTDANELIVAENTAGGILIANLNPAETD